MIASTRRGFFAVAAVGCTSVALTTLGAAPAQAAYNRYGLTALEWKYIQRHLWAAFDYNGGIDGDPGPQTWRAMQRRVNAFGPGVIDGNPGPQTWSAVQRFLNHFGYNAGPADGIPGPQTTRALRTWANRIA